MPGPANPPIGNYVQCRGLWFVDGIAEDLGYYFWTYPERWWAVGPYSDKNDAVAALRRYERMSDEKSRTWSL